MAAGLDRLGGAAVGHDDGLLVCAWVRLDGQRSVQAAVKPGDPVLRVVGLPVAVGNAVPEIRALSKVQLTRTGGFGAVREFAELLLKARGDWDRVVTDYLAERIDTKLEVLR